MSTLAQVQDKADQRLTTLRADVILPMELKWFVAHGEYPQCLYTQNLPDNKNVDVIVRESFPVTNIAPDDREGMTAKAIFGDANIDVLLPFALAVHVYNGPQGHGFVDEVRVKHEGATYIKSRNYGAESWRTHDWRQVGK